MPRNGSETSSTPDTSRQATLTSEASLTCTPTISEATPNAISSQGLADGPIPSGLPDGMTLDLFGQDRHRVKTLVSRERHGECAAVYLARVQHWLNHGFLSLSDFDQAVSISRMCPVSKNGLPKSRTVWRRLDIVFPNPNKRLPLLLALIFAGECGLLPTVTARDYKNPGKPDHIRVQSATRGEPLPETFGLPLPTALAAWLMGFPPEWMQSAPLEMQSTRKSRQSSSKHQ
jgi:hypothetical protein